MRPGSAALKSPRSRRCRRYLLQECAQLDGKREVEFHPLSCHRMREAEPSRMQKRPVQSGDRRAQLRAFDRIRPAGAISRIRHDRMLDVSQMDADLVSAPGLDFHVEQREFVEAFGHSVESRSLPAVARDGHLHAVARVAADRLFYLSGIFPQHPIDQRYIAFRNRPRFELLGQIEMRAVRLRNDNQSRSAHIQAMYYAGARRSSTPWWLTPDLI